MFYEIVKNDTCVYLALDPDAIKKTNRIIDLLLRHDIETYFIDASPYTDIGEMTYEQFLERKQRAVLLDSNNYLLSRITRI